MSEEYINNIQRIAYSNAVRRGFYGNDYTVMDAHRHLETEAVELGVALDAMDMEEVALEAGDVMLLTMGILYELNITVFDALTMAVQKELGKKSG